MTYFPGQLISMRMENFMTFDDTEINFHPNINLIIGPNGTGKSSIVSALCLGLGGTALTLGKHGAIAQFIKHSKAFSRLTIKLSSSSVTEGFLTIQLTINLVNIVKQTTKLQWKLNQREVSYAIIREKLQTYNINVNNLCQFLAQDRVIQLSKLNKFQLLREFEETISHKNHINFTELHDRIISEQNAIKHEQTNFKSVLKEMDFAQKNKELYESDYLNLEKEKNLNMEIDKTDYIINMAHLTLHKKQLKDLDMLNTNQKSSLQDYQVKQSGLQQQIKAYEKQLSKFTKTNTSLTEQLKKTQAKFKQANSKFDIKKAEIDSAGLNKENVVTNLKKTKKEMADLKDSKIELERFIFENRESADFEHIKSIIKENKAKIIRLGKDRISLESGQVNLENCYKNTQSLIQIENNKVNHLVTRLRNRKLANVFSYNFRQRTHELVESLRNKKMFKGKVCGPLIAEITTKNALVSLMVETAISNNMKFVYICNNAQDVRLINARAQELRIRISIILQEPLKAEPKRVGEIEYLKQNNVNGYLDQFIECNELVRSVLYDHCNLHNIAVSFKEPSVENMSNILPSTSSNTANDNKKCKVLYTKSKTFYTKTSFYNSSKVSINIGHYFNKICYLFDHKEEIEAIKRQNKSVYENLQKFEEDLNKFTKEMAALKQELVKNQNKIDVIKDENNAHEEKVGVLIEKEKELEDVQSALNTKSKYFKESIKALSSNNDTISSSLNAFYGSVSRLQETQENILQKDVFLDTLKSLQKQVCKEEMERLKVEKTELEEAHQQELATIKDYKERKKEITDHIKHYNKIIKSHRYVKTKYKKDDHSEEDLLTETIHLNPDEVDMHFIKDMEEKLLVLENKNKYINYNVDNIKNYTRASKRINELSKIKNQKENYLNERKFKFDYEANNYVKELQTMVQNLDSNFSKLFKNITNGNGSGNILLRELEDYSKLSLEILIRFRKNEQMKTLKHTLQSGGEKSLVTMVFLLSLQSMNSSPFRLVDEINQGMDAYNERKLMDTVKEKIGKTQYFIITPKLLSGFTFSENVKVHFVVNGPYIANKEVLDVIHQASKKVEVKDTNKNYYDPKKDKSITSKKKIGTNKTKEVKNRNIDNAPNKRRKLAMDDGSTSSDDYNETSSDDFLSEQDSVENQIENNNRNLRRSRRGANNNTDSIYDNHDDYIQSEEVRGNRWKQRRINPFTKVKKKTTANKRVTRLFDQVNHQDNRFYSNPLKRAKVVKPESDSEIEIEFEEYKDNPVNRPDTRKRREEPEIEFSLSD